MPTEQSQRLCSNAERPAAVLVNLHSVKTFSVVVIPSTCDAAARVMDYIESGKLSVANIKFFVLDEADRLLDTGNQVLVFSLEASIGCFY